jgi:hypothetical protein
MYKSGSLTDGTPEETGSMTTNTIQQKLNHRGVSVRRLNYVMAGITLVI